MPGPFTPRTGGLYTRETAIQGTEERPGGIPGRSLATVTIQSPTGKDLLVETRIREEGSESFGEVLAWTGHAYDAFDRRVLDRDATGVAGEYRYNPCCGKLEWERDAAGVETHYLRDEADRVTAKIVKAPGRPEVETHYEYGPFGQVLRETVVAGDLVQETTHEYDEEGERIATTTPDGLTTRYEHDHAARVHTTVLPGGATRIETRYLDGQVKSLTGTSVVAQHYDYGVDAATGHRWTQTFTAKADSPRWTRSHTDALGQSTMHEAPGHGEGVILSNHTAYDDRGRVVATQPGWRRLSAGADDEKGSEFHPLGPVTLQTYDEETGEPLLTGQDLDGDERLVPGKDRVAKSERRFEEIEGDWWEVTRQWSYPLKLEGEPYLVGESRQRLTGLGKAHEDPALGVLVGESVQLVPGLPQKGAEGAKTDPLVTRSVTYRNRESGLVTVITTDPKGLATVQRTEGGLLASVETAGAKTAFAYDALGRRISVVDPRTGESKTAYDPKTGYVIAEIDPEGRATRYARYPADHPSAGRLATVADAAGKEQHIAYTPRGEQRAVWGDSVQPLLYEYNDYGERTAMRTFQTLPNGDPSHEEDKGARTAWHYDEATGALLRKEYADGHGPEYAYTEAGQLKERQWARNEPVGTAGSAVRPEGRLSTAYEYDPATLQLLGSNASDGTEVTYEYDAENRPAKVTDATGTREFAYDLRGQVLKESVTLLTGPDTPPIRYEIRRTYTALGQPESVHLVGDGRDAP